MGNPLLSGIRHFMSGDESMFSWPSGLSGHAGRISPGSQAEDSGKPGVLQLDHAFKPALE